MRVKGSINTHDMDGKCKWYHKDKGFGVICNDDGIEFFVHRTELKNSPFLKENQMVTFTQSTQKTKNTAPHKQHSSTLLFS